jgi:hypothetical protein
MTSENETTGGPGSQGPESKDKPSGEGSESRIREKRSDDTWKERAKREKEKLAEESREEIQELPPASFLGIVEDLSVRALLALGQIPNPATGEVYFDPVSARYTIDLLAVLEEKTRGNLTPEEASGLQQVLHNLRLAFVHVSRSGPSAGGRRPAGYPSGGATGAEEDEGDAGEAKAGPKIIL